MKLLLLHLGPVLLYEEGGKTYLRAAEQGTLHTGLSLQFVYPANELRSDSDPILWEAARNTMRKNLCWENSNQFCALFVQAIRLGISPKEIVQGLGLVRERHRLQNGLYEFVW